MIYEAIVLGVSAGGLKALTTLFTNIKDSFKIPILLVQHMHAGSDDYLARYLASICKLTVKEADEKERIKNKTVYIAPANYHLMIEDDKTLSLTIDQKVNYSRPSIDVLFESAVDVYNDKLIGVILTGANDDGARGMEQIKKAGGLTIIQNPKTAEVASMPEAVTKRIKPDHILELEAIAKLLNSITI